MYTVLRCTIASLDSIQDKNVYLKSSIFQKSIGEVNKSTLFTGNGHGVVAGRVRMVAADSPIRSGRLRQRAMRLDSSRR